MNKQRRTQLTALAEALRELESQAEDIKVQLEELKSEEQDYKDNMPEAFQQSEKGERADAAIEALESADGNLEDFLSAIGEISSNLENIVGHLNDAASDVETAAE